MPGETRRTYREDKAWEESWIPHVIGCIKSRLFLAQAKIDEDQERVTDIMLSVRDVRIGVRIRHPEYFDRYGDEVTLRCRRDSGAKTEWEKVLEGHGDLLFYGFANPGWQHMKSIRRYTIVSLHAIRRIMDRERPPKLPTIPNGDGTYFHPLKVRQWLAMDRNFVVDANWSI